MTNESSELPQIGDPAPYFSVMTAKGVVDFPDFSKDCWCIFFSHPANFTSAWWMYSTFLAMKERWFNARNTKMLTLSNEPVRLNDWSDKVRRYIGIYLKAPVIEDLDFRIANLYGMASRRRKNSYFDRLAYIIDPKGIIRVIINNPLPSIEGAILDLERELDRLQQGKAPESVDRKLLDADLQPVPEATDAVSEVYAPKPAYLGKNKINPN